jgi:hypothetical protein
LLGSDNTTMGLFLCKFHSHMTHLTVFLEVGGSQTLGGGDQYMSDPRVSKFGRTGPLGGCAYDCMTALG